MAGVVLEFGGDDAKLLQAFQRLARAQERLESGLRKMRQESMRTQRQQLDTFGNRAVTQLQRYVAQIASISAAWRTATTVLREYREEQRRSVAEQEQAAPSIGQLGQVADAQHSLRDLRRIADMVFGAGGTATRGAAADLVFSLKSAGLLTPSATETVVGLGQTLPNPDEFIASIKTVIAAAGQEETGGFRDVSSKTFAASGESPSRAPSIAKGASIAAGQAQLMGVSDEDLFTAMAFLATTTGTGEQGGAQLLAFLKGGAKQGFEGMTIEQMVTTLASRNLSPADMQKALGRSEAVRAFTSLQEAIGSGEFARVGADVNAAVANDRTGQVLDALARDPEVASNVALRQARAAEQLSRNTVQATLEEAAFQRQLAQFRNNPAARGLTIGPFGRVVIPDRLEPAAFELWMNLRRNLGFGPDLSDPQFQDLQQILEAEQRSDALDSGATVPRGAFRGVEGNRGAFAEDPVASTTEAANSLNRAADRLEQNARPPMMEGDP